MKTYKGAIFDLDGTLLNTLQDLADSVNEALTHFGLPTHEPEAYKLKIGKGFRNLIEVSLPEELDPSIDKEEVVKLFVQAYDRNYCHKTVPYQGITELLCSLHAKGVKLAVNSNKRNDYTDTLIKRFFGDIPFVAILGEREGLPKKPDPYTALEIASLMELTPEEIVYIGDSKTDMQTGKNAGMGKAGAIWGYRGYEELKEHGADHLLYRPEELEALF